MNENQEICWHYVMDIHNPEDVWYSLINKNILIMGEYK